MAACTKTSSEGIATRALLADFSIGQTATTVTARAEFRVSEGGTYVELAGNDQILCNGTVLLRQGLASAVWYGNSVKAQPEGARYAFELRRADPADGATVTLMAPVKLAVATPRAGDKIKFGQQLPVTWTPAGTAFPVTITASGRCIDRLEKKDAPDTGDEVLDVVTGTDKCDGTVSISRSHTLLTGAPFKDGKRRSTFTVDLMVGFVP